MGTRPYWSNVSQYAACWPVIESAHSMAPVPPDSGSPPIAPESPDEERAVDRALHFAQSHFGLGCGASSPAWVRPRVLSMLRKRALVQGLSVESVAESLAKDEIAQVELETALRVGETRFYRDAEQWQAIEQQVLKSFPARAKLNVLSAGCSTGEEAYTAAMVLKKAHRQCHVLGVDRSAQAIERARKGEYGREALRDIPAAFLSRYCEEIGNSLRVRGVVSELVSFKRCDLVQEIPSGPFHLIFFKNVLLYLPENTGEKIAGALLAELDDTGFLFPAASEVIRLRKAGFPAVRVTGTVTAFRKPKPSQR